MDGCAKQCAQWREVAMCGSRGKGLRPQSRPELQGVDARRRAATTGNGEVNSPLQRLTGEAAARRNRRGNPGRGGDLRYGGEPDPEGNSCWGCPLVQVYLGILMRMAILGLSLGDCFATRLMRAQGADRWRGKLAATNPTQAKAYATAAMWRNFWREVNDCICAELLHGR